MIEVTHFSTGGSGSESSEEGAMVRKKPIPTDCRYIVAE